MVTAMARQKLTETWIAGIVAAALGAAPSAAEQPAPIVIELYTSQGCSSCPPADAFFAELARQPGIVALGFHVDYWNYLGWADPFSSKKFTYRQKEYAMSFRQTGVYTPQMVVNGRRGEVGSDRSAVMAAIVEARKHKPAAKVTLEKLGGHRLRVTIAAAAEAKGAHVWLALFDLRQTTKILRGENEGKTLVHHHVVRDWKKLGEIAAEAAEFTVTAASDQGEKRGGAAVVVQQPKAGSILGAAFVYVE
jgi:hypothetical protein